MLFSFIWLIFALRNQDNRKMDKKATNALLKELRETLSGELDVYDFEFGMGELTADFGTMDRELELSDNITAVVDFKAEGWRHVDRGDYYTPPEEHGEITISITHVDFYDINGDKVAEHDAPWPSCYDKQNTIKLTF